MFIKKKAKKRKEENKKRQEKIKTLGQCGDNIY